MYHLDRGTSQLRVCGKYLRQGVNRKLFENARFLVLQHILPTTEELLLLLLEAGAEISAVIAKPYSIDADVFKRMNQSGLSVFKKSYAELETTDFLSDLLAKAIKQSEKDKKRIVILEVGGYFADHLTRIEKQHLKYFAGVVEDTTFGHNRYERLIDKVPIKVFSVARSELKEVEARFVGQDAVMAIDHVLRDLGVSVFGRRALVIGYGMIGKNLARALREYRLEVAVYDKRDHRNLRAFTAGFSVNRKLELLRVADIVFSVTGDSAVSLSDIELCKDNAILASVGSKDTEFDIRALVELSVSNEAIGEHIVRYTLPNSKNIVVINGGTAVNFIMKSLPVEIIDLVFAEILRCSLLLLRRAKEYRIGRINVAPEETLSGIAKEWLKFVNH